MSGPRIGLCLSGADAAEISELATLAEAHNIDLVVVGNARAGLPNGDDTYVVTAAAAAAVRTRYLRIAVVLDLRGSSPPLRVAEDLGVLDVMSNGRLELLLRPSPDPSWSRDLDSVLGAWTAWPLAEPDRPARAVPVTPSPVQPAIPTWLVEPSDPPIGRPLSRGACLVFLTWSDNPAQGGAVPGAIPGAIPGAAELLRIRQIRDDSGSATVVFDLAGIPARRRADVVRVLGTVVAPCLRCPDDEVGILALDTTDWLLRRTELHQPPLPDRPTLSNHGHPSLISPSTQGHRR